MVKMFANVERTQQRKVQPESFKLCGTGQAGVHVSRLHHRSFRSVEGASPEDLPRDAQEPDRRLCQGKSKRKQ